MPSKKKQTSSYQEYERMLSRFFISKNKFLSDCKEHYCETSKAKDFYFYILTKLKKALIENRFNVFERMCSVLECVNVAGILNKAFFSDLGYPLVDTNLIILACKHNRPEILKYLFLSSCKTLSITSPDDTCVPYPECIDSEQHNVFYYAIRSSNMNLLSTLTDEWPGIHFASDPQKLDKLLSEAYEELKLKRVFISEEMEIFVESLILDLRFFSENSIPVKRDINNINERIKLVIEKIQFLKVECSNSDDSEIFLFTAKFIAQNLQILKRGLKSTYTKLPWEEMEFCLIHYIFSRMKRHEMNFFFNAFLSKSSIIKHLQIFAKVLEEEILRGEHVDINDLATLPNLRRDEITAQIIRNNPEFSGLYDEFEKLRDICSLEKINSHLKSTSLADPKEREGQLTITRALQIIGEYFKNTLESPKLSKTMSELLLVSLPRNTRKIIVDLRNAFSHSYSLSRRNEIEEKTDVDFYIGLQNDAKIIESLVTDILLSNKMECIKALLRKIASVNCQNDLKEILKTYDNIISKKVVSGMENFETRTHKKLEKIVEALRQKITDPTHIEEKLFQEIDKIFEASKAQLEDQGLKYVIAFAMIPAFIDTLGDHELISDCFLHLKFYANHILKDIDSEVEPCDLKDIIQRSMCICMIAESRVENERLDDLNRISLEFFYLAETKSDDIKWIEKLREQLVGKGSPFPYDLQEGTSEATKEKILKARDKLMLKLNELKNILKNNDLGGKTTDTLTFLRKREKLRPVVEMLVLDVMSVLGNAKNCLQNNLFFLDDYAPLLNGKCLRDHLAHGNALVDILPYDPALAVILNAKKLVSVENLIQRKKKIGKSMNDDPSSVKRKYNQNLATVRNQEKLFTKLAEGNLKAVITCLTEGADINSRNLKEQTATHFACMGSNLDVLKLTLIQVSDATSRDVMGQTPLHTAAKYGNRSMIELLLKETDLQVDDTDNLLKTPLHIAAINGQKEAVEILLRNKASTTAQDGGGNSALHYAVRHNHVEVVKTLLKKEKHVDSNEVSGGYTSLHMASENGHLDLVNFLLNNGANPNALTDIGRAPIHSTALRGYLEVLKALIQSGADVNVRVVDGCTPLHYAVENSHEQAAKILLHHGADPNVCDKKYGNTPLHYAVLRGHVGITNALLKSGANASVALATGETPLHLAAKEGHPKIVATLLKHGVDIHAKNNLKSSPLHLAAAKGDADIVERLIRNGADVNLVDAYKKTALHAAASEGHANVIEILIRHKGRINAQNSNGDSALHAAAFKGKSDVVNVLLRNNALINIENSSGLKPIQAAIASGCKDSVQILIKSNAGFNTNADYGSSVLSAIIHNQQHIVKLLLENYFQLNAKCLLDGTALNAAVKTNSKDIVKILIEHGASVNAKVDGTTPLMLAVKSNHVDIVESLLAHGANVSGGNFEPLFMAVLLGHKDIIKILLERGAPVNLKYNENVTALHIAAQNGDERTVKSLILRGAQVNALTKQDVTPLFLASAEGHEDIVKILIANKADINIASNSGTPLHIAVSNRHPKVVEILLDHGAKVSTKDDRNRTSLEMAISRGDLQVVEMLFKQNDVKINGHGNDGWTMLHIAAQEENVEIVKFLVDNGADVKARNSAGSEPLHIAAREGRKNTLEFFLSKGLSIHEIGKDGQTPLHYASMKGHLEVVKYLIACGADVNLGDSNGSRPLHIAAFCGQIEAITVLLMNGAFYNPVNKFGKKALEVTLNKNVQSILKCTESLFATVRQNKVDQVKELITKGACIDAKHSNYGTPLHYAVWKGYTDIIDCLLENGANPNPINDKGFTPLHYAAKYSQFEATFALLHEGAIYDQLSNSKQTPLNFASDKRIIKLLDAVDKAFRNVKSHNIRVISDLKKISDKNIAKAIMRAHSMKNESLVVAAMHSNFPKIEELKQAFQGNMSLEVARTFCSMRMLQSLLDIRKDIYGENNPGTLDVILAIAKIYYSEGKYFEAQKILNVVCEKQEALFGINNEDVLSVKSLLALILYRLDKNEESFEVFQKVYPKQKELLGPNHDDTLQTLFHMALVMERLKKYDDALSSNMILFEKWKKSLGENNLQTIVARNNIALVLRGQGKLEDALKIYREVLAKKKKILGIQHRSTLRTYRSIAAILSEQKKSHEALKICQELLGIHKNSLGPTDPETLDLKYAIANELLSQGKHTNALKAFKEVYEEVSALYGIDHPQVKATEGKMKEIDIHLKLRGTSVTDVLKQFQKDICIAASNGDFKTIQNLLKNGVDVNEKDVDGRSPLHYAISSGHISIVKYLLKSKADPSSITNKGNTPLHTAADTGQKEAIELLLQHVTGKKLNTLINFGTTANGTTALHVAAKNGSLDILKSLLKFGAKYNVENKDSKTPLDVAKQKNIYEFLKLAEDVFKGIERGSCDIIQKLNALSFEDRSTLMNARNSQGNTLLLVAIGKKHKNLVSQLLSILKH